MLRDAGPRHYLHTSHSCEQALGKSCFVQVQSAKNAIHIKSTLPPLVGPAKAGINSFANSA